MQFKVQNRIELPRISNGIDWGIKRFLLFRYGSKIIFKRNGHSGYGGRFHGTQYYPGEITGYDETEHISIGTSLHEGRIKNNDKKLICRKIAKYLSVPVKDIELYFNTKHSIIITD